MTPSPHLAPRLAHVLAGMALLLLVLWPAGFAAAQPAIPGMSQQQEESQQQDGAKGSESAADKAKAPAEPGGPPAPAQIDDQTAGAVKELERLKLIADRVEAGTQREGIDDRQLAELRREIDPVQEQARTVAGAIEPRARAAQQRLQQLGPAPQDGEQESELIANERRQLTELLATLQGIIKQGNLLALRAEQLASRISEQRRNLFTGRIFERRDSGLKPSIWIDAIAATPKVISRFGLLVSDWWAAVTARLDVIRLLGIGVALILLGVMYRPLHEKLLRLGARDPALTQPSELHKATAAVWLVVVYLAVPLAALLLIYAAFNAVDLMPDRVDQVFKALLRAVAVYSLIQGISWALFAPTRPTWRMVPLSGPAARRINALAIAIGTVYALGELADAINRVTFAPLAAGVGKDVIVSLVISILAGFALVAARPERRGEDDGTSYIAATAMRWRWLILLAWLAVILIPVAIVFGYLALANFAAAQFVIGSTIIALATLIIRLIDSVIGDRLEGPRGAAGSIASSLGTNRENVLQIGIVLAGLGRVLVILFAILFLAVPWGIDSADVTGWLRTAFFGFQAGEIEISFSSILLALTIFIVGAGITRALQGWLDTRFLPHTRLDTGLRNSIRTAFGYVGVIIAATVGFAFLGLDLSNLAIVAGALSVGIGFGLQSVVNNFVSGLILLAERPIKVGDWIVVGNEQGYVSKIAVRATEIETFDRSTVIVPNSDLISGVVKNWMHTNRMGRIEIPLGVSYASDPEQVRDILLQCADEHPSVMRDPSPRVYFTEFGASSLDFTLFAYISAVENSYSVRSDLRFSILKSLRGAGVEIPFPQTDLNLRDMDRLERALSSRGGPPPRAPKKKASKKTAPKKSAAKKRRPARRSSGNVPDGDAE